MSKLIAINYPNGQRAIKWGEYNLNGVQAMEKIPSTRRLASAVAAIWFQTKTINPEVWGISSLSPEDVEYLNNFIKILAVSVREWYLPNYTVKTLAFFSPLNDDSGEKIIKQRAERIIYYADYLYFRVDDDENAIILYEELKKLPYLGRSESIVEFSIFDDNEKLVENHNHYKRSNNEISGGISNFELIESPLLENIIDTAPANTTKISAGSKILEPKDCMRVWWHRTNINERTIKVKRPVKTMQITNKNIFMECRWDGDLIPNIYYPQLNESFIKRLSKDNVNLEKIKLSPIFDSTYTLFLGWELTPGSPLELLALSSIGGFKITNGDYFISFDTKIINKKGVPYSQLKSNLFKSVSPVLLPEDAPVETIDDAVDFIKELDKNIKEVRIIGTIDTLFGGGLECIIQTKELSGEFQLGDLGNLAFGTMAPVKLN